MASVAPSLNTFVAAAEVLQAQDREDLRALGVGMAEWAASKAARPLESALGIRKRGGTSIARGQKIAERNATLRRLWRSHWRDLSPTAAAAEIVRDFREYETRRWPREKLQAEAPADAKSAAWWRSLRSAVRVPDVRQVTDILKRSEEIESGL